MLFIDNSIFNFLQIFTLKNEVHASYLNITLHHKPNFSNS